MSRYRTISIKMWGDERFSRLSKPLPNAQTLWVYLLTGPHTTALPGVFIAGEAGLAEALNWPIRGFRKAFDELLREGLIKHDKHARLVFIPKAIRHNPPQSPNVVIAWRKAFDDLPDCELKQAVFTVCKAELVAMEKGEGFLKAFGEDFTYAMPESEQEQEQYQEHEQEQEQKGNAPIDPRRSPLTVFMFETFKARYGELITDGSDFQAIKTLLGKTKAELPEIERRWMVFLDSENQFHRDQGHPVRFFCSNYTAFNERKTNGNGKYQTKDDRNREAARRLLSRLDSQNSGGVPGGPRRVVSGDLSRASAETLFGANPDGRDPRD